MWEAKRSTAKLQESVTKLLESHEDLALRIKNLEREGSIFSGKDNDTIRSPPSVLEATLETSLADNLYTHTINALRTSIDLHVPKGGAPIEPKQLTMPSPLDSISSYADHVRKNPTHPIRLQTDLADVPGATSTPPMSIPQSVGFTFEADLNASFVYRRNLHRRHSQSSLTSSALMSTALSVFSKLSLSQISNLSVYALPIYTSELYNPRWFTPEGVDAEKQRVADDRKQALLAMAYRSSPWLRTQGLQTIPDMDSNSIVDWYQMTHQSSRGIGIDPRQLRVPRPQASIRDSAARTSQTSRSNGSDFEQLQAPLPQPPSPAPAATTSQDTDQPRFFWM
jgi:hypothetical protein